MPWDNLFEEKNYTGDRDRHTNGNEKVVAIYLQAK